MTVLERASLIIVLVIVFAIGLPILMYISLRRENLRKQVDLLRTATQRMAKPWKTDDDMLKELSETLAKAQEEERKGQDKKAKDSSQ